MFCLHLSSVMKWEEPFDSTVYCVRSDGNHALLAGMARYGMTRLWDKRSTKPVQVHENLDLYFNCIVSVVI